jgi:hypothetical protein
MNMRHTRLGWAVILLLSLISVGAASAQEVPANLPDAPSAAPATTTAPEPPTPEIAPIKEGHERMLGFIPAFSVTNRQDAAPLTPRQKFVLFARSATDPVQLSLIGLQAGISQAEDEFPEYGQGATGYGKRYGAALLDSTDGNFFANFVYPVIFKQDPRYFRLGTGSIKHRILYSFAQEFSTKSDAPDRHRVFNWSNVLGAFTTGAISNAYYPSSDRGATLTLSRSAISLLYGSVGGLASEFWPDVNRKFFHRKSKEADAAPAADGAAAPPASDK